MESEKQPAFDADQTFKTPPDDPDATWPLLPPVETRPEDDEARS